MSKDDDSNGKKRKPEPPHDIRPSHLDQRELTIEEQEEAEPEIRRWLGRKDKDTVPDLWDIEYKQDGIFFLHFSTESYEVVVYCDEVKRRYYVEQIDLDA